jgi:hypothetical protein
MDHPMHNARSAELGRTTLPLLIVAVALVVAGQAVLLKTAGNNPREGLLQAVAGVGLIGGALLFGVMARRQTTIAADPFFATNEVDGARRHRANLWSLVWLTGAVLTAILAAGLFSARGESPSVVALWLASAAALLVSQVRGVRLGLPRIPPGERWYLAGLAALVAIAFLIGTRRLATLPQNLDGDFASVGLQARALATGEQRRIFEYGWARIPILGYLPPWLSMRLFGPGLTGLNSSAILEGLLVLIGIYLLGREMFHPRIGLVAAAWLAVSYTYIAASRQATYIDPVFFIAFSVFLLLRGLRKGEGLAIVASGGLTAMCLQTYYSGRVVVFIIGAVGLYLGILHREWFKGRLWYAPLWLLSVCIFLGPMLLVFARDLEGFMSRSREVFILDPQVVTHMQGVYRVNNTSAVLLEQARHTALMFHYYHDKSTQFGSPRPFLDPVMASAFTLGIGYALFHWRTLGPAVLLGWLGIGATAGAFLTVNPPFWPRLLILLPPAALLAAAGVNVFYELSLPWIGRIGARAGFILVALIVVLAAALGAANWRTYVEDKGTYATARTRIARYLANEPPLAQAYLVSRNFQPRDREFEFLAPGRLVANLWPLRLGRTMALVNDPALLILTPENASLLAILQQRYPTGKVETHHGNAPDEVAFYVFRLR